jgi:hypothetical protein
MWNRCHVAKGTFYTLSLSVKNLCAVALYLVAAVHDTS